MAGPKGNTNAARAVPENERTRVLDLWEADYSVTAIALKTGLGRFLVQRVLREAGIQPAKRYASNRGQSSPNFRGGRTVTARGYIGVHVDDNHPHAAMRNGRYVLEHRLVMAESLGRDLRRNETVHHINGDRTDNRLVNLQLRQGQHGVGVRYQCLDCLSHNVEPIDL